MEIFFLVLLLVLMAAALASGFPVAFALPGSSVIAIAAAAAAGWLFAGDPAAYFAVGGPDQWLSAGVTNFRGIYWEIERDTLIAIPLFVFMGIMLQRSKIAEDLLVTMAQLFGPVPGGLGISVVLVGGLLAATTGIVGATVVAMGLISLPAMMRANYSHPLATGTIAASGTLGQIIPPSIVLIILADQLSSAVDQASSTRKQAYQAATGEPLPSAFDVTSTSAGDLFMGAMIPGVMLVGIYLAYILTLALLRPRLAPAMRYEGAFDARFLTRVVLALVPPLALIIIVLGSIIMGVATVNQAGAIGAAGAMIMAGYRLYEGRRTTYWPVALAGAAVVALIVVARVHPVNIKSIASDADRVALTAAVVAVAGLIAALLWSGWRILTIERTLHGVMLETAKTTSLVFIILLGAAMLTAAFRAFGGEELVREFLTGLPGGFWMQFFIVMAVIFFLGFFIDFIEIAVVVVPIVAPILLADPAANVTAVWLGVAIGLNMQTSFLTPPFGFALFYLRGVAPPSVTTLSIYKGVVPFVFLQLLALAIASAFPTLANYLPTRTTLLSETAPPPVNPRLQYCVERHVFERFDRDGAAIRTAIAAARRLDVSYLPPTTAEAVTAGLDRAEQSFALINAIDATERTVEQAMPAYRPLLGAVRVIQTEIARLEAEIGLQRTQLGRIHGSDEEAVTRRTRIEERIAHLRAEQDAERARIPAEWDARHEAFLALIRADEQARLAYRRAVDEAYKPVRDLAQALAASEAFAGLGEEIAGLGAALEGLAPKPAGDRVQAVANRFNTVAGSEAIRGQLARLKRAAGARTARPAEVAALLGELAAMYEAELTWRRRASAELLPGLEAYAGAVRDTIGLRSLPRLPDAAVDPVARCLSRHRDISHYF